MKYFVSSYYDGCWYYRCYLPMLFNGFSGDKESFGTDKNRTRDAKMVCQADTIIYQRPDEEKKLESAIMLKNAGKKIVFENDDTYKDLNPMKVQGLEKRNKTLDNFIKLADLVTTTTEFLADEYRKLNPNVVVLKNCINPDDFPEPKRNRGDKVRIGIFGSTSLNGDCEHIKDLLKELGERDDVTLVVFGLPPKQNNPLINNLYEKDYEFWENLNIEWHPFVEMRDYFKKLNDLELDMCLIPRKDNYFNHCKSNLKFLEASMLKIPVIAQGFEDGKSPYQGEDDGDYMLIAKNDVQWRTFTYLLIKDKEKRLRMGEKAYKYVLDEYNIKNNYKNWQKAYKNIC